MKLFGGKRSSHRVGSRRESVKASADSSNGNRASAKKHKLTGLQRGLLILLGSLVLLAGTIYGVYRGFVRPPTKSTAPDKSSSQTEGGNKNTLTAIDEITGEEIDIEYELPGSLKDNYYNILILGTDDDGMRTDTIMIARMDTTDHTVALMSIPRDTLINSNMSVPKINSVYGANGQGEEGIKALKKQLTAILGFEVDGYVMVDLQAFVKTVDLLGGITFDVPRRMYYSDPTQNLYIDLYEGVQELDGAKAIQLVRFRGYSEADIQRTRVQQDFLKALAKKCLTFGTIAKISPLIDIFVEYVETDLTAGNMAYFAQELLKCDFDSMETFTLPGEGVTIKGGSYFALYAKQVLEIVNENFNPYDADIPLSNLHIRTASSSSSGGSYSSSSSGNASSSGSSTGTTPIPPEEPGESEPNNEAPTDSGETTPPTDTPDTGEQNPDDTVPIEPPPPIEVDDGASNGSGVLDSEPPETTITEPEVPQSGSMWDEFTPLP